MNSARVFFRGGVTSYRALFGWLNPWVGVPMLVVAPLFQLLFFAFLGRSAGLESDCAGDARAELGLDVPFGEPPGLYHFVATDRAGDEAVSTQRQDGSSMTLQVPLKVETELRADLGPGGKRLTIGYDRASEVSGRGASGAPRPSRSQTPVQR